MSKSPKSSSPIDSALEYLTKTEGFECSDIIGKGTYGSVLKVSKKGTNEKAAAKIVETSVTNLLEIQEWPKLQHNNVLRCLETFLGLEGVVIFVTDLMETNLFQRLRNKDFRNGRDSPDKCRLYARQVLSGLAYLHSMKLCHLDLRAENVLISFDDRAVVADFSGLCKSAEMKRFCPLPSCLRPPEMLEVKKRVEPMPVDLWSYGLLVAYMYLGKGSYDCTIRSKNSGTIENCRQYVSYFSTQSYFEKFFHETYPKSEVSVVRIKELIAFILLFLHIGPEHRIMADAALESGFLNAPFYRTVEPSRSGLATSHVALVINPQNNKEQDFLSDDETDAYEEGAFGEDLATRKTKKKTWFRVGRIKVRKPSKFLFRSDKSKTDQKPDKKKKHTKFFI